MTSKKMTQEEMQAIYDECIEYAKSSALAYEKVTNYNEYCGLSWVWIKPANHQFAKFLKSKGYARKNPMGPGICVDNPSNHSTQRLDIKEHGAEAFADKLREHFDIFAFVRIYPL